MGLIWTVVRKAERSSERGVLIVPDRPESSFCMLVKERLKEGKMVLGEKFRPIMNCPREIVSNTFCGALKFDMCVISFDFMESS